MEFVKSFAYQSKKISLYWVSRTFVYFRLRMCVVGQRTFDRASHGWKFLTRDYLRSLFRVTILEHKGKYKPAALRTDYAARQPSDRPQRPCIMAPVRLEFETKYIFDNNVSLSFSRRLENCDSEFAIFRNFPGGSLRISNTVGDWRTPFPIARTVQMSQSAPAWPINSTIVS